MQNQKISPITSSSNSIECLKSYLQTHIIGQNHLIDCLLIALLADGHLLVEGAPGLAKTKTIRLLSKALDASFHRIQFTPDLLPADITGTDIYHPGEHKFSFQPGPIFHHLLLADEINRAGAKVQSALLEAMEEHQVTVGDKTHQLSDLFIVMATQNSIEQAGTHPLPEAQLDRFLLYVTIDYPNAIDEKKILSLARQELKNNNLQPDFAPITIDEILNVRKTVQSIHMQESIEDYLIELVMATRKPEKYDGKLSSWISSGASPRATIALEKCSKAHAYLNNRDFVSPADVQSIAAQVLAHRIILSFEAQAQGIDRINVIEHLLSQVVAP